MDGRKKTRMDRDVYLGRAKTKVPWLLRGSNVMLRCVYRSIDIAMWMMDDRIKEMMNPTQL